MMMTMEIMLTSHSLCATSRALAGLAVYPRPLFLPNSSGLRRRRWFGHLDAGDEALVAGVRRQGLRRHGADAINHSDGATIHREEAQVLDDVDRHGHTPVGRLLLPLSGLRVEAQAERELDQDGHEELHEDRPSCKEHTFLGPGLRTSRWRHLII